MSDKMDKFIGFMYPVKYSPIRPTVSLKDLGITEIKIDDNGKFVGREVNVSAILSSLLGKNKCWSYEEEWRTINVEGKPYTPIFVEMPFVKSITLGLNLDDICRQLLWDVCKERDIESYQLVMYEIPLCKVTVHSVLKSAKNAYGSSMVSLPNVTSFKEEQPSKALSGTCVILFLPVMYPIKGLF